MAGTATDLTDALAKHRAGLDAGEQAAADRLVGAYGTAWASASAQLDQVLAKLRDALDAGEPVSPAWLYQEGRLRHVVARLEAGLRQHGPAASLEVLAAQQDAVQAAAGHVADLLELQAPDGTVAASFVTMPEAALRDLIGHAADGSPLRDLLDSIARQAGPGLEQALVGGLAQGLGPRELARAARQAVAMPLHRALTVARTEVNRAYRESTGRHLEANADVVAGWTWVCACDRRSCAVCWAMSGRQFPVDERLDGHPNCRCAMVPLTKSWESLGFAGIEETAFIPPAGTDLFARAPEEVQRAVLGPGKLRMYQEGDLRLEHLVARPADPRWGTMRVERSATEVRRLASEGRLGHAELERLGPGTVERDTVPAWVKVDEAATERLAAAARFGVTPAELEQARHAIPAVRRAIRAEAKRTGDELWGNLGYAESPNPPRPPAYVLKRSMMSGQVRRTREAASWEWFEQLGDLEKKRVRRWFTEGRGEREIDGWANVWADAHGIDTTDTSVEQIMDTWLQRTRDFDASKALAAGRLPAAESYPGLDLAGLLPDTVAEGYNPAAILGADELEAAGHIAQVWREQAEARAFDVLGTAADYTEGPAPWRMSVFSYEDELADLEGQLADARAGSVAPPPAVVRRWLELVPEEVDEPGLSAEALHDRIVALAQLGRLE